MKVYIRRKDHGDHEDVVDQIAEIPDAEVADWVAEVSTWTIEGQMPEQPTASVPPLDPAFAQDPNWALIQQLRARHHPVVTERWWDWVREQDSQSLGEQAADLVASHHLLDLLGVPCPLPSVGGAGHPADLDVRVWRAVSGALNLLERLARISDWHSCETGPHGTFGDYCTECGTVWPCDTRRMADGTHEEATDV